MASEVRTTTSSMATERDDARRRLIWTAICFVGAFGAVFLGRRLGFEGTALDLFALAVGMPLVMAATIVTVTAEERSGRDDAAPRRP
jgi:Mg/Co/Ni transporter MgtE